METRKTRFAVFMSVMLILLSGIPVSAAEMGESDENYYVEGVSIESAESLPIVAVYAVAATTAYHTSNVNYKYGKLSGCTLTGTCYCTIDGAKVSANYSAETTFYHSNGDKLIGSTQKGGSTSSTDFTWTSSDDSSGSFYTTSTSTDTTCSKSGFDTVHITNTTSNPN